MDNIIYIGNNETAIRLEQAYRETHSRDVELQPFIADQSSKTDVLNVICDDNDEIKGAIINVDEMGTLEDELMDIIEFILSESDIKLCLLCCGRMKDDDLILDALELGIQYLMLYPGVVHNARIIENILEGIPNVSEIIYGNTIESHSSQPKNSKKTTDINKEKSSSQSGMGTQTVAIGACVPRMGATTLAIQLIKYFQNNGISACYIDSSESEYMDDFLLVYENEGKKDETHNRFTLEGIDFYYDYHNDLWEYITQMNYDYIIFDMGFLNNENKTKSFKNTDYHILCAGSKANEFKAMGDLLKQLYTSNTIYAFYSVPKAQVESIKQVCEYNNQKCCFIPYIDDEFVLQQNTSDIFYNIFL